MVLQLLGTCSSLNCWSCILNEISTAFFDAGSFLCQEGFHIVSDKMLCMHACLHVCVKVVQVSIDGQSPVRVKPRQTETSACHGTDSSGHSSPCFKCKFPPAKTSSTNANVNEQTHHCVSELSANKFENKEEQWMWSHHLQTKSHQPNQCCLHFCFCLSSQA